MIDEHPTFFQEILDKYPVIIFTKDILGKYTFINQQFEKELNTTKEKTIGKTDSEIFPTVFADALSANDKLIIESGKPLTFEEILVTEKETKTYSAFKFPLKDVKDKPYAIGGIYTEISNYKLLQNTLRSSENRFKFVTEATQDSIYDWDLVSDEIWRNEQYERIFDGPFVSHTEWWNTHLHPDDFQKITKNLQAVFEKKEQLWNQEYRFKTATGKYADLIDRGFINYSPEGKPLRMIGALTDITERKQFVNELERLLALSKATLESTTAGILVVNSETKIVDYNKKFVKMWNIPDSILDSKEGTQVITYILGQLTDPQKISEKDKSLITAPETESFDILYFKDGRVFERNSKPLKTKLNTIGRVWSFQDITQRKKTEEVEKIKVTQILLRQQELLKLASLEIDQPFNEKLKIILKALAKSIDVERVSVYFFNEKRDSISSEQIYEFKKNIFLPGVTFQKNDSPRYFQELEDGHVIDANNAEEDPRTSELNKNYLKPFDITSLMVIPIRTSGKIVGFITNEHSGPKRIWSYEDQAFGYSIADLIALAIQNEEKKKGIIELTASEERFRMALSQLPILFFTLNKDLRFTYAGGSALAKIGLNQYDFIGKTISEVIQINDPDNKTMLEKATSSLKGEASDFGYKFKNIDFHVFLEPLKDGENNMEIRGVSGLSIDISESKIAEEKIRVAAERFRKFSDISNEAIVIHENGKIVDVNPSFSKMFGYTETEVIGMNDLQFVAPESVETLRKNLREGVKEPFELVGLRKDGSTFFGEIQGREITYEGKRMVVTTIMNITKRKNYEMEIKKLKSELEKYAKEAQVK